MSKKIAIITILTLLCSLFLNLSTLTLAAAKVNVNNSKIYKQRTFNVVGKGVPEKIAEIQDRMSWSKYEPTGIYVAEDEEVKINVENGDSTVLYIQSYSNYDAPYRWDEQAFPLSLGQNTIKKHKSGVLYLANLNTTGHTKVNISGGSHIPVFEKTDSDSAFTTMMAEHKDAPYVEYVSDYALITVSYTRAQEFTENPSELLKYIDIALAAEDKMAGLTADGAKESNQLDPHYRHLVEDPTEDYYMYATNYRTAYAGGGRAVKYITNAETFKTDGWSVWHEIGHSQQQESWNFYDMTEVQVNLYSLAAELALGNESHLETGDEYRKMHDYFNLPAEQKNFDQLTDDSDSIDFFLKLTMLWQLHLGLGENFYPNLHAAYRELPLAKRPTNNEKRKNYFMYIASKVAGRNLLPFFDQWGLNPSEEMRANIVALNLPMLEAKIWESTDANPISENIELLPLSKEDINDISSIGIDNNDSNDISSNATNDDGNNDNNRVDSNNDDSINSVNIDDNGSNYIDNDGDESISSSIDNNDSNDISSNATNDDGNNDNNRVDSNNDDSINSVNIDDNGSNYIDNDGDESISSSIDNNDSNDNSTNDNASSDTDTSNNGSNDISSNDGGSNSRSIDNNDSNDNSNSDNNNTDTSDIDSDGDRSIKSIDNNDVNINNDDGSNSANINDNGTNDNASSDNSSSDIDNDGDDNSIDNSGTNDNGTYDINSNDIYVNDNDSNDNNNKENTYYSIVPETGNLNFYIYFIIITLISIIAISITHFIKKINN